MGSLSTNRRHHEHMLFKNLKLILCLREGRLMPIFQAHNKMPCSKETPVMLLFNTSCSFYFIFLFFYFSSSLIAKFFRYLCQKTISQRAGNGFQEDYYEEEDNGFFTLECMEKEEDQTRYQHNCYEEEDVRFFTLECTEKEDLVADIIQGGDAILFLPIKTPQEDQILAEEFEDIDEPMFKDSDENFVEETSHFSTSSGYRCSEKNSVEELKLPMVGSTDSAALEVHRDENRVTVPINKHESSPTSPKFVDPTECDLMINDDTNKGYCVDKDDSAIVKKNISVDENFLIFHPPPSETKKIQNQENDGEDTSVDSFIEGSTSKSSSEWRSSINYRDSGTEDPFSSSSRRSCPTWESYTVFRKYDEEMMFFDRISAQKLNEADLLRKIEACPRSISERIVHKLTTTRNKRSSEFVKNPYQELETAYVAQICLTWEALNWNYKNFQRIGASRREEDPCYSGQIAQQFQQFQVLLQRYIENEPYEQGRRPEIYARTRISAPKLLQVPEFRDSENDRREEGLNTKVSSIRFLIIMEDAIRTFMNFLKADREKHYQKFTALFKRNHRASVDLTLLHLMKKANKKKKMKLKDLRRAQNCLRKKARLGRDEEMQILMALIDLKVVSRVLRMTDISEEQLQWCQEKMSKVRLWEGRLQRDSSPLFFPAHYPLFSVA